MLINLLILVIHLDMFQILHRYGVILHNVTLDNVKTSAANLLKTSLRMYVETRMCLPY